MNVYSVNNYSVTVEKGADFSISAHNSLSAHSFLLDRQNILFENRRMRQLFAIKKSASMRPIGCRKVRVG